MGTRTPNYDLYIPGQGEEAWDDEVGGNFTTIDAALQALAAIIDGAVYQINNVTYVTANARWTGSVWNRADTGKPAVRLTLNSTNGSLEIATAAAGANPITWTTVQAISATGLDMKAKKAYNLATPTASTDAATKGYVDTATANRSMGGYKLISLGTPSATTDAATKAYVDGLITALKLSDLIVGSDLNLGSYGLLSGGKTIVKNGVVKASAVFSNDNPIYLVPDSSKTHLMKSFDSEFSGSSSQNWTLTKSFPALPAGVLGESLHVSFESKTNIGNYTTYARIYVNGQPVGTTRTKANTTYTVWDETITGLKGGDVIQLYTTTLTRGVVYCPVIRNFRVYGKALIAQPLPEGVW